MSAPFTARYPGECSDCGGRVNPGDIVRFDADDCFVHAKCSGPTPEPSKICEGCFMEVPIGLTKCPDCG